MEAVFVGYNKRHEQIILSKCLEYKPISIKAIFLEENDIADFLGAITKETCGIPFIFSSRAKLSSNMPILNNYRIKYVYVYDTELGSLDELCSYLASKQIPVVVSKCLLGVLCRYDGKLKVEEGLQSHIANWMSKKLRLCNVEYFPTELKLIPICPETELYSQEYHSIITNMHTPRSPSMLERGRYRFYSYFGRSTAESLGKRTIAYNEYIDHNINNNYIPHEDTKEYTISLVTNEKNEVVKVIKVNSIIQPVLNNNVTDEFFAGAICALQKCEYTGAYIAYLKAKSPSCGPLSAYYAGDKVPTVGVMGMTAGILKAEGLYLAESHI